MRILFILLLMFVPFLGHGQSDEGNKLLSDLENGLKKLGAYEVPFEVLTHYKNDDQSPKITGRLTVRGNCFRVMTQWQQIYCDGRTIWVYDLKTQEVNVEAVNPANRDNVLMNPSLILQFDRTRFDVSSAPGSRSLTLRPKAGQRMPFAQMTLDFGSAGSWSPRTVVVVSSDAQGSRISFSLGTPTAAEQLSDAEFRFDTKKHPGVDVVDFR